MLRDAVDQGTTFPQWANDDFRLVPLADAQNDPALLDSAYAIMVYGGRAERRIVASYDGVVPFGPPQPGDGENVLRLYAGFDASPHEADYAFVYFQPQYSPDTGFQIGCAPPGGNADFCLMERYHANPAMTEFCSASNHDENGDTAHHAVHGKSCWEVIQETMLARYDHTMLLPDPAVPGDTTQDFPIFFDLAKEARIALVMDRSGSMSQNSKMQGARFGVEQWIRASAEEGDFMSVSWFNESVETPLALTSFDNAAALDGLVAQANDTAPGGYTNIRDGLYEAIAQIESRDGRAALQAIVLLTDGIHNRPEGSSLLEAVPSLQEAGIAVYVIYLGGPETVELGELEQLALETGGAITDVYGLGQSTDANIQAAAIAIEMAGVNGVLRDGLVEVDSDNVEGFAPGDPLPAKIRKTKTPSLTTLLGWFDAASLRTLKGGPGRPVATARFLVEKGALRARFTVAHGLKDEVSLFLIDPSGKVVPFGGQKASLVDPVGSPFAMAFLDKPKPGRWTAVMVRTNVGGSSILRHAAVVENRQIVARADCDRVVPNGGAIRLSASAKWGDDLTNLDVRARIVGPDGLVHEVGLDDGRPGDPGSGRYRGVFDPAVPGRYRGLVTVLCRGDANRAGAMHRLMHTSPGGADKAEKTKEKGVSLDLRTEAPTFVRRVPIYFDVGGRPVPKDLDG
ncbi:MAG: VWA domain-containing protein, partial [Rhodospirillaceae bacterium]|nr:VWA domain-containing protein [Rhodospirillaceae bacterium]